jgi:type VI secretion system secreted protein Hcp
MAFDAFLKIQEIPGESLDERHKNEIEIESYSFGLSKSGTAHTGGGGGAGKASFQDFHFVSRLQKSSPKLFLACATGEHIKEAVLSVRQAANRDDFWKVTLSDVLVTSWSQGGAADGQDSVPMEQISLNYVKIKIDYAIEDARGALGEHFIAEFNVAQNTDG